VIFVFVQCNRDAAMLLFSSSEHHRVQWSGTFVLSITAFTGAIAVAILLQFRSLAATCSPGSKSCRDC